MQNMPPSGYATPYGSSAITMSPGEKSSTGLDANIAGAISYIGIVGLVFFLIEKSSKFVRFHALQSVLLGAGVTVLIIVLMILWAILAIILAQVSGTLATIFSLLFTLLYLALVVAFFGGIIFGAIKAYQGQIIKFPFIGNMAEKIINK